MSYENGNFNNGNGGNNEEYRPVYYSPITMKNPDSGIDPSELSFQFWKGMLGIAISPKVEDSNASYVRYDHKNNGKIYINTIRARMLLAEMEKLKANPDSYNSVGVPSGTNGIICVSNGKEVGVAGPVIIIRKIDQSGQLLSSYIYEFNQTAHFSIRNFDESTSKYDRNFFPDIEYDTFMGVLKNYVDNSAGYTAAAVFDISRINHNAIYNNLSALMAKFDVQTVSGGRGKRNGDSRSFFDMANQGSQLAESAAIGVPSNKATAATMEELEGDIG